MASSSGSSSSSKSRRPASSRSNPPPQASSSSRPQPPPPASSSSRPQPPPPASPSSTPPPASPSSTPPPRASSSSKPPPKLPKEEIIVDGIAKTCWVKFSQEATFALYTPFIVCVASGTLEVETLRQCIAQDVHFLKPFDQAFELAETYAVDDDDRRVVNKLRKITKKKLNLHDYFVQEWGSDVVKDTTPNPATSKCIDFLSDTALGKIDGIKPLSRGFTPYEKTKLAAYILGAMTSCIRLNAYIGKEARGIFSEPRYNKWIQNYSSNSFQDFRLQTEKVLDKLSEALTVEELGIVERVYSQGIKHEIDYFLAQPLIQKAIVPLSGEHNLEDRRLMIFSDFDLTCTKVSSSASFAELSVLTARVSEQISTENQIAHMTSSDLKKSWDVISEKYRDGYERCIKKLLSTEKAVKKFNYEGLRKALEKVSDFEKKENLKVIESGLLKGLQLKHIKHAGEVVKLQDGCMNFFQTIKKKNAVDVYVLSYCWSGYFIRAVFTKGEVDDVKVHANDLEFVESVSTGGIMMKVQSPIDKVEAFDKIILESSEKGNDKKKLLSVYIGGDVGDLLCLLKADVGIVLASSSSESLRRVGKRFGVRFVPLFSGVVKKQRERVEVEVEGSSSTWKCLSGIIYIASSWAEIHAFVIGS
ncbi:PREDICTED: probable aminopyrimidine aminohydrolase, mitochondrial [Ipomoea nil]|uniref:probable aminopyrimidine aminohydrolase, mitochondrial n=1 Tax=Ipomoea nil TaxID=35883 RepID=UPI0009008B34|nr:PREDICTED: probable aminopyrimidine aminohydrolase, mitochondrial [Ipomoea nil]